MIKKEEFYVKVVLPDKKIEADVNQELEDYAVDEPFEITEAMKIQPVRYLKWADMLRRAKQVKRTLERQYEEWHVKVVKRVREVLEEKEGNKKPTKDDLHNGVVRYFYKTYTDLQGGLDSAQDNVDILDIVVKANGMKKDMLVSVGQLCSRLIDSGNLVVRDKKISKGGR